jgi:hypothetical protein
MDVATVLVDQLEANGELRTFRMHADFGEPLTVSFADAYEDERSGPFHFLDSHHEQAFRNAFAECRARRLGAGRFSRCDNRFRLATEWAGIPTELHRLSYYALSLPEFAIPSSVKFADPRSGREYQKNVVRDDLRKRFVLYLECRSSHGAFDFVLDVDFEISPDRFAQATFKDGTTGGYGSHLGAYEYLLPEEQKVLVQNFMSTGDQYVIGGQAGAVGPSANAEGLTFRQSHGDSRSAVDSPSISSGDGNDDSGKRLRGGSMI